MKKTFVDSSVLLTAFRGVEQDAEDAFRILNDPDREFVSSVFVKLELLPKAIYHKNLVEIEFFETFFEVVKEWAHPTHELVQNAFEEAAKCGIAALDALHVAAAASVGADELVTAEKPFKPIYRSDLVKVVCIHH